MLRSTAADLHGRRLGHERDHQTMRVSGAVSLLFHLLFFLDLAGTSSAPVRGVASGTPTRAVTLVSVQAPTTKNDVSPAAPRDLTRTAHALEPRPPTPSKKQEAPAPPETREEDREPARGDWLEFVSTEAMDATEANGRQSAVISSRSVVLDRTAVAPTISVEAGRPSPATPTRLPKQQRTSVDPVASDDAERPATDAQAPMARGAPRTGVSDGSEASSGTVERLARRSDTPEKTRHTPTEVGALAAVQPWTAMDRSAWTGGIRRVLVRSRAPQLASPESPPLVEVPAASTLPRGEDRPPVPEPIAEEATRSEPFKDPVEQPIAPPTPDFLANLREDLGLTRPDRSELQEAESTQASTMARPNAGYQAVVDLPYELVDQPMVVVSGSTLGVYLEKVEMIIRRRWNREELPIYDRAIGVQGKVTVQFHIDDKGRISQSFLVSSSGNDELDRLALRAIPDRLPPIPRELAMAGLRHKVTLRYKNPLISSPQP